MKISKIVSVVFALVGILLIISTAHFCFRSLDSNARILSMDPSASQRTEEWMEAVCKGDYTAVGNMMFGQPELHVGRDASGDAGVIFWDALISSMTYEFEGDCYATQTGLARDVTVTALDISAAMAPLRTRTEIIIEQWIEELEYMDEVYDENNNYRDTFVMKAACAAAEQILEEGEYLTSRELTLKLIYEDGQWWILAEQDLINVLSGKMI